MDSDSCPQPERPTRAKLRPEGIEKPRFDRFDDHMCGFADAMERHAQAVEDGSPGYFDPSSGLFVMTAAYLRDRGYCCDSGCRHCPFEQREPTE